MFWIVAGVFSNEEEKNNRTDLLYARTILIIIAGFAAWC
ncbi:hypothetical protein AD28_2272 [Escherichia coli 2-210-07_S4_C3]|nr:hypothetical protein AD28_2272 [Escherichia coli 2-210-07_S4_C3]KEM86990.1 hypothetical protein AC71_3791 [Escherichia coli 2-222-05_S4_C1]